MSKSFTGSLYAVGMGVVALALVAALVKPAASQNAQNAQNVQPSNADSTAESRRRADEGVRFLKGAIDMHWHTDAATPGRSRQYASILDAKIAAAHGLRGVVIKNHYEPTASLAYLFRLELPREFPDFTPYGGIVMNLTNGGENAAAVEFMATQIDGSPGKIVWMPAGDSEIESRISKTPNKPFVAVSRNGVLTPETKAVIATIAKHHLVLATGHISPEEAMLVLAEGKKDGVQHMIVTHAMDLAGKMTPAQIDQALQYGPIIEFDFRNILSEGGKRADEIRKIGPEHCLISEFWTHARPMEYAGFESVGVFVEAMHARGFTDHDLDIMVKDNPAKLLELPVLPPVVIPQATSPGLPASPPV
jgi:hypothetical protein